MLTKTGMYVILFFGHSPVLLFSTTLGKSLTHLTQFDVTENPVECHKNISLIGQYYTIIIMYIIHDCIILPLHIAARDCCMSMAVLLCLLYSALWAYEILLYTVE